MQRRQFLKGLGAVTLVAAGGTVWRAWNQGVFRSGSGPAYEPWHDWEDVASDGPLAIVHAGILASNPHNTQPWAFRVTADSVELYADTARNLGTFDPYLREMHLGLGCALENMLLAAKAQGYLVELFLPPGELLGIPDEPGMDLVARLTLRAAPPVTGPLFEAIGRRHTNRGAYLPDRPLTPSEWAALHSVPGDDSEIRILLYSDAADTARFRDIVEDATEAIIADGPMIHDSEAWFRHSWADVQRFRDGPTLDAAGLSPTTRVMAKMLPRPSAEANHQYWLDATREVHLPTAPTFGLILGRRLYDRPESLRAGRVWQRMHLTATAMGLAMQPLNQPVERVDRERQLGVAPVARRALQTLVEDPQWHPTFAFRVGHPARAIGPSPRRSVEQVLIEGYGSIRMEHG